MVNCFVVLFIVRHLGPCCQTDIRTGKAEWAQIPGISRNWEREEWSYSLSVCVPALELVAPSHSTPLRSMGPESHNITPGVLQAKELSRQPWAFSQMSFPSWTFLPAKKYISPGSHRIKDTYHQISQYEQGSSQSHTLLLPLPKLWRKTELWTWGLDSALPHLEVFRHPQQRDRVQHGKSNCWRVPYGSK